MKAIFKKALKGLIKKTFPEIREIKQQVLNTKISQTQLWIQYQQLKSQKLPLPDFRDTGFRVYSQVDEDGMLLFVFSMIGTTNKICVDIACGQPYGSNSTNLICNWGWTGLLMDGDSENISVTKQFYDSHPDSYIYPPIVQCSWITTENVNKILMENGVKGEIDLLLLDIDGVDYWIWKSIDCIQPRVVVVEYQDIWGPAKSVTVPYSTNFNRFDVHEDYFGASLMAFVKLAKQKGYRLVGCNRLGYNAFFVKTGLGEEYLPEIPPEKCFRHPKTQEGQKQRLPEVAHLEWTEV